MQGRVEKNQNDSDQGDHLVSDIYQDCLRPRRGNPGVFFSAVDIGLGLVVTAD
jgi:hypothetical protein